MITSSDGLTTACGTSIGAGREKREACGGQSEKGGYPLRRVGAGRSEAWRLFDDDSESDVDKSVRGPFVAMLSLCAVSGFGSRERKS